MNVLVVGGAGYLGGAVTDLLLETNHKVKVYDKLLYEESYRKQVEFIYGDVRDETKLKRSLKWADVVIWLAALVGDPACEINPKISEEINAKSVKFLSKNFKGKIIFTSTCSVYGANKKILNETSAVKPLSVYAETKLEAEKYLKNKNAIIFRLGTLFGLGDVYSRVRMDLVINYLTARAYNGESISVFGGNQYRPVLHVRDAARAIVDSLETDKRGIFILNGENIKIVDLAKRIHKFFPKIKISVQSAKFEDTRNYRVDSSKSKKILKFDANISVEEGIGEIRKLLIEKRIKDINNPRFTNQLYLSKFKSHELIEEKKEKSQLIKLEVFKDSRGEVKFINNFSFQFIKRFYYVKSPKKNMIRAWHAHKLEKKYITIVSGKAIVGAVKIDKWDKPSKEIKPELHKISCKDPAMVFIPEGYANGVLSLEDNTEILVYSTSTLEESKRDDFRFPENYWKLK